MQKIVKLIFICATAVALSACGGGGSDGAGINNPDKVDETTHSNSGSMNNGNNAGGNTDAQNGANSGSNHNGNSNNNNQNSEDTDTNGNNSNGSTSGNSGTDDNANTDQQNIANIRLAKWTFSDDLGGDDKYTLQCDYKYTNDNRHLLAEKVETLHKKINDVESSAYRKIKYTYDSKYRLKEEVKYYKDSKDQLIPYAKNEFRYKTTKDKKFIIENNSYFILSKSDKIIVSNRVTTFNSEDDYNNHYYTSDANQTYTSYYRGDVQNVTYITTKVKHITEHNITITTDMTTHDANGKFLGNTHLVDYMYLPNQNTMANLKRKANNKNIRKYSYDDGMDKYMARSPMFTGSNKPIIIVQPTKDSSICDYDNEYTSDGLVEKSIWYNCSSAINRTEKFEYKKY